MSTSSRVIVRKLRRRTTDCSSPREPNFRRASPRPPARYAYVSPRVELLQQFEVHATPAIGRDCSLVQCQQRRITLGHREGNQRVVRCATEDPQRRQRGGEMQRALRRNADDSRNSPTEHLGRIRGPGAQWFRQSCEHRVRLDHGMRDGATGEGRIRNSVMFMPLRYGGNDHARIGNNHLRRSSRTTRTSSTVRRGTPSSARSTTP